MRTAVASAVVILLLSACQTIEGDQPTTPGVPDPAGTGNRIREIGDPSADTHAEPNTNVAVSGVTVVAVDNYDETSDGKSRGSIYVQDLNSTEPYSGIGLFSPTFVPSDLKVAPGDVLDMRGEYQENDKIGTTVDFNKGLPAGSPRQYLPQIASPTATFRFEGEQPKPTVIDLEDFNDFDKGRKWIGMLVTVKNAKLTEGLYLGKSGRHTGSLIGTGQTAKLTMSNELMPLDNADEFPAGTTMTLTGVVTYFFNFHIAPRTAEDIVVAK